MSYDTVEASVHDAKPIELFKFEGTYANYFYTSGPELVTFLGDDYTPLAIKRTEVSAGTQEDDGLDITVTVPVSSDLAQTYGFSQTPPKLKLTIYRYHSDDPANYVAYWIGPVTNIQTSGGQSDIQSPSVLAYALSANVPNVYFQTPCNHVLFDARCKVVEDDFNVLTNVTVVNNRDITVAGIGLFDGMFVGGELAITASGERRMIVGQAGDVITVNFPFFGLIVGTPVSLTVGCDHAYNGDCKNRFANQINFGGFPFIPDDNIFTSGMTPGTTNIGDATCLPTRDVFAGWYVQFRCDWSLAVTGWPAHFVESLTSTNMLTVDYIEGDHYFIMRSTNPADYAVQERQLRLQFPAFSVPGGSTATFTAERWDDVLGATNLAPKVGSPSHSFGSPFGIEGLNPDNWYFDF